MVDSLGNAPRYTEKPWWMPYNAWQDYKAATDVLGATESKQTDNIVGMYVDTSDGAKNAVFFAEMEDAPFLGPVDNWSDFFNLGLGSYAAGVARIYQQFENGGLGFDVITFYGGLGFDVITFYAGLNTKGFGLGVDIFSFNGNIRFPIGNGEYFVIEGEVGVGLGLEFSIDRIKAGIGPMGGIGFWVES
jgi:hypothetical protein